MYKKFTAKDYRTHLKLPDDYFVEGVLVFGTYK
jgi:hypothetical protein